MKKKIAIFHCGFVYSGGGERLVLEEAKNLRARGYLVDVYSPTLNNKLCFPEEIKRLNVQTFLPQFPPFIPARYAASMVLSSLLAPFLAWRFRRYDVIIGANQPGAWIAYCVSRVLGKPYLVYLNQPNRLLYPRAIDEAVRWQNLKEYYYIDRLIRKIKRFVTWADRVSFTSGRVMLVNGEYIGQVIESVYGRKTVTCPAGANVWPRQLLRVNPHTAYTGWFKAENLAGRVFRINRPFFLLTNRHVPQKKFEYGIASLKLVLKKHPNLRLVIPGPHTVYTLNLISLARKLGVDKRVIFTGQVDEETLQKLYRNAAVYIYTAPEEDFGMGVIEAMGWGVPVVAWNFAGPTVTVKNGVTGFLAKPYVVEDFADKIVEALQSQTQRSQMGLSAWRRVKRSFSWERHADILEKYIREYT